MAEMSPTGRKTCGSEGKFIVNVKFMENATWQGTVILGAKQEEVHFRSALELLKIMDNALAQGAATFAPEG